VPALEGRLGKQDGRWWCPREEAQRWANLVAKQWGGQSPGIRSAWDIGGWGVQVAPRGRKSRPGSSGTKVKLHILSHFSEERAGAMGVGQRLAFLLLLLLLLRGLGQPAWPATVALALRWLLGDRTCIVLLGLAVLFHSWISPWMPHWVSLAAAAFTLTLLPPRLPPGLRWLPADMSFLVKIFLLGWNIRGRLSHQPPDTFVDAFERQALAQPGKVSIVWTGPGACSVTFGELDARACQAAWALKAELGGPDSLRATEPAALLMLPSQSIPALSLWLGLAKLGCPVAWINPNSRGKPLVHSVLTSGAQVLVVDPGESPSVSGEEKGMRQTINLT
jgi:hypothetical protein